ncbi:MAG: DUF2520 domain-containing protein [bacterium]|nr:DUF2520 domain-containing protein [bacterium]
MKTSFPVALLATGRLRDYPVLRLRSVADRLGPVKAQSFRLASRIANSIHAGYPVHTAEELASAKVVLICAPDSRTPHLVTELASTRPAWQRRTILLCCNTLGSAALAPLAARGASVGSMALLTPSDERRFLVEGDRPAVRYAKSLIEPDGGQVIEVLAGTKPICQAAFSLATWLMQPLMNASTECMRDAGLPQGRASSVVDLVLQESVRSYLKAGRRAWSPPRTVQQRQSFLQQLDALDRVNPELARFLRTTAIETLRRMHRSSAWLEQTRPLVRRAAAAGD